MRHRRPSLLVVALLVGAGLSASCSERLVERDIYDPRIRCALLITHIEEPGQERFRLEDSETGLSYDLWCTCTTHEEWLDDEEFRVWVNEMAYEACVEFVEREGYDPEHSTCLASYDEGYWTEAFGVADYNAGEEPRFCEGEPVGCGVE